MFRIEEADSAGYKEPPIAALSYYGELLGPDRKLWLTMYLGVLKELDQ